MPKKTNKISDTKLVEIIGKRLAGAKLSEIAKECGVSEQTIQYYEAKESTQELKAIVLRKMAEDVGSALAKQTIAQLDLTPEDDEDPSKFIIAMDSGTAAAAQ